MRRVDHAGRGREVLRRVRDVVEGGGELVGERAVVAGFGEVGPGRRNRGEEGIAGLGSDASAEEEREVSHRGVHAAANRRGGR
ncbi:MAG: hypothetical protein ACKO8Z_15610 [Prosthecobacter sp.]